MHAMKAHPIRAMIVDMDGVLWRGAQPLIDLPAAFERIRRGGWKVVLATNNATRSPQQYVEKLASFGVQFDPDQIVNSAQAAAYSLHRSFPDGGPVFVVGEQGLLQALAVYGFYPSEDGAVAVVAGLDRGFTFEKLRKASRLIRSGALFVGTNPDLTFPSPQGIEPGAGALLAAIEAASGVSPTIAGKPQPGMYRVALERLGAPPGETLVIGDRLDTDIAGAQALGCPTALVLSGVTTLEAARTFSPLPDIIAADLTAVLDEMERGSEAQSAESIRWH